MTIQASVTTQQITAAVSGGTVAASVPAAASVQAAITGGIGPQGPAGTDGGLIDGLADVEVAAAADGQILRYDAQAAQWKNQTAQINGGNF
jgi:hypothetical protein